MSSSLTPAPFEPPQFTPPSGADFDIPPMFPGVPVLEWIDKPTIQLILSGIVVYALFAIATRSMQLVPGRAQFAAEKFHGVIRDQIARDTIGPDFRRFVPLLVTLFTFIFVNNLYGIIPAIQFPTFSRPGMAYALAILTWVVYNYVGIRKQGLVGYVKLQTWPSGVPWWVRFVLTPIEVLSNFLLRPVTLAFRLFGNMFAGHLVILLLAFGAEYMFFESQSLVLQITAIPTVAFFVVFAGFELFILTIQAYIFTILTASYIGASLADEH